MLYNIPTASNPASADFLFSSPYMNQTYDRVIPDYLSRLREIYEEEAEDDD